MWTGHHKEIRKLMFWALALRLSEWFTPTNANARNISFRISLRWPIHIINAVDKTKLCCYTFHQRSTTYSFFRNLPLYWNITGLLYMVASWLVHLSSVQALWLGTLCCLLEQDTLHSHCFSPPRWMGTGKLNTGDSLRMSQLYLYNILLNVCSVNIFMIS